MAGKVITVSSVKGGVGKTTMVLNLAGIYCGLNKKVLIIDLDDTDLENSEEAARKALEAHIEKKKKVTYQ